MTLGGAYFQKDVVVSSGDLVKLNIWDTGGSERARPMVPLYYRDSQAGLITFDLTQESSFNESVDYWTNELQQALTPGTYKLFLVGNKKDLADEQRQVSTREAQEFADKNDMVYFETSSKTGEGVAELFSAMTEAVA